MPSVFISYRRDDSQSEALLLKDALVRRLGAGAVFLDTSNIAPGAVWPTQLRRELAKSDVVLAVIGPDWFIVHDDAGRRRIDDEEDWVRQELAGGLASGKTVIPVCVCGTKMAPKRYFPLPLQPLADRQAFEIRMAYWDQDVKALLDLLAPEERPETAPAGSQPAAPLVDPSRPQLVNPYKLFYFRSNLKLSFTALEAQTGIPRTELRDLERTPSGRNVLEISRFRSCSQATIARLEAALGCPGRLTAGKDDDFLTQYMDFYRLYGGGGRKRPRDARGPETSADSAIPYRFSTKAVVFDFDGTLTSTPDHRTTWEQIWLALGYTIRDCATLHTRYQRHEITHPEWCALTRDAFRRKGLTEALLSQIAADIGLIPGVEETVQELRRKGVLLYILSGSIKSIIRQVIGSLLLEFDEIKANEMVFDEQGRLREIVSTPFDFQGKAEFLKRLIKERSLSPESILFVGNSCNDIFASQAGVRTLCVNPRFTDPANEAHWTYSIPEMSNLREVLELTSL